MNQPPLDYPARSSGTRVWGLSDPGCRRANNEDNFLIREDLGLFAVADGMGGANAGEVASRLALEALESWVERAGERSAATLQEAFLEAHRRIQTHSAEVTSCRGMGTTMVALLVCPDEIHVASVGDSRAYLLESDRLVQLTQDQTWVEEVGRAIIQDEETLRRHPYRHVLTQALGVGDGLRVQTHRIAAPSGATVILSTDGLHGVIDAAEIRRLAKEPRTLCERCHSLIEAARKAGGPDNITVVLIEF